MRERLGPDQAEWVICGAAPLSQDVHEFLLALGLPMTEVYGMSECSCVVTVSPPTEARVGSGRAARSRRGARLADDGELLIRGEIVMRGYRADPERTAEVIDDDGWLHTGDVGEIDDDGYLQIVDRKKELIINAAGKNMSPANIEAQLKGAHPLIGQAVAIGDGRPYNVALLVLDPDAAGATRARTGDAGERIARMRWLRHEAVQAAGAAVQPTPTTKLAARGADQALRRARRRVAARRRRADPDDEAQAQADRGQVCGDDRGAVREADLRTMTTMKGDQLRAVQTPLKERYRAEPEAALVTLAPTGSSARA